MNLTTREDSIRDRLSRHFISRGFAASPIPADEWEPIRHELGPHARFGVAWPLPVEYAPFVFSFCPSIVTEVTAELSDEDLDDFLGGVEWLADIQISYQCDGINDPQRAYELAEDDLREAGPGTLALIEDTQARALDRGIGC